MAGKHPASSGPGVAAASTSSSSSAARNLGQNYAKRSRAPGIVTANACNECRKKRAKCDGEHPCGRCTNLGATSCIYEVPMRQSKEALRSEVDTLQRSHDSSDRVFAALVRPDLSQDVLARLRNGMSVESITKWLEGAPQPARNTALGTMPTTLTPTVSLTSPGPGDTRSINLSSGPDNHGPAMTVPLAPISPLSSQLYQTHRHDDNLESPWPGSLPSTHSYTVSATSDFRSDVVPSTADTTPQSQMLGFHVESDGARGRRHSRDSSEILDVKAPAGTWTRITDDSHLVQHVLALYFCWEYPIFAPLSKEHFLKAFKDGDANHCSSILVNAILANGCRFSSQPRTRADPADPDTSGDHFFQESIRLLHQERDHHNLTTIQALGILSVREASRGCDSASRFYAGQSIRLAVEMGLNLDHSNVDPNQDGAVVELATFWGALTLELVWSLATGSLPHYSLLPHLPPKPAVVEDVDASLWIPCTDNGSLPYPPYKQVSNVRSVFRSFCELSELIHQTLYMLYSPPRPVTSRNLTNIYHRYIKWYDKIPSVLRLGDNFTPAVIFVHMYYHFAILVLLRHFIKFRILNSLVSPREVCLQAADAIQSLSHSYSQLYTLRRTPAFIPYFVLMSSTIHLTIASIPPAVYAPYQPEGVTGPWPSKQYTQQQQHPVRQIDPGTTKAVTHGIEYLKEMASCRIVAERAISILLRLAKKWRIDVKTDEEIQMMDKADSGPYGGPASFNPSRPGLPPLGNTSNMFPPYVKEHDPSRPLVKSPRQLIGVPGLINQMRQACCVEEERTGHAAMPETVENDLLWPFSLQPVSVLAAEDRLPRAGFEAPGPGACT